MQPIPYKQADLPLDTKAGAVVRGKDLRFEFTVNEGPNASPLKTVLRNNEMLASVEAGGNWFGGLEVVRLPGLNAVRSHMRPDHQPPKNRRTAISRWYLCPTGTNYLFECIEVHSRPAEITESWKFKDTVCRPHVQGNASLTCRGRTVTIRSRQGWSAFWCFGGKTKEAPVGIEISPDPSATGMLLLKSRSYTVQVTISLRAKSKRPLKITVRTFGLFNEERVLILKEKTANLSFEFNPRLAGMVPLLVLVETREGVAFRFLETFVFESALESSDATFNGIFTEYLKGIHRRRIFGAVPEESSRGEFLYGVLDIWPRNLHGFGLAAWGFPEFAVSTLKVWQNYLLRDGFLDDSYSIQRSVAQRFIANDGIGFFLFCLAKTALRKPDCLDRFFAGIEAALRWLNLCTHWNGLLNSHCEAVSGHGSTKTAGNPYPQSICMAGLAGIIRVLSLRNDSKSELLLNVAEDLLSRQMEGFLTEYEKDGFFRDPCTGPLFGSRGKRGFYLSTYSALAPGTFLFDPEIQPLKEEWIIRLRLLVNKTFEVVHKLSPDENPRLIPIQPGNACLAYCMLANVISLLHCNRFEEAGKYLKAVLDYSGTSVIPYYLPEGIAYPDHKNPAAYRSCLQEVAEQKIGRWYPEKNREGIFGFPRNHGNLVHMTYFLYLSDVIAGISHTEKGLTIAPKLPGWPYWRVFRYATRYGAVNYCFEQKGSGLKIQLEKPAVSAVLELPPRKNAEVLLNGKPVEFTDGSAAKARTFTVVLPEKAGSYSIDINRRGIP